MRFEFVAIRGRALHGERADVAGRLILDEPATRGESTCGNLSRVENIRQQKAAHRTSDRKIRAEQRSRSGAGTVKPQETARTKRPGDLPAPQLRQELRRRLVDLRELVAAGEAQSKVHRAGVDPAL